MKEITVVFMSDKFYDVFLNPIDLSLPEDLYEFLDSYLNEIEGKKNVVTFKVDGFIKYSILYTNDNVKGILHQIIRDENFKKLLD